MNASSTSHDYPTVIVTGGAGYIGSVLVRRLLQSEYRVVCVDNLAFGEQPVSDLLGNPDFVLRRLDITDFAAVDEVLHAQQGRDCSVVHLAAIVGDPACALTPELARRVNLEASLHLIEASAAAGVGRFVFASTCSNYGKMPDSHEYLDEASRLSPVSLYARLKVEVELAILQGMKRIGGFCPTCLRFATAYGVSPRMRFDLTVNEFTKELALGRVLDIFGSQFWRPYCHVEDLASAVRLVLAAPEASVAYDVFNVGSTPENYTKEMLAQELLRQIPGAQIRYTHKEEDPRDYRVEFAKIRECLGFESSWRVSDGIEEILGVLEAGRFEQPDHVRHRNTPAG